MNKWYTFLVRFWFPILIGITITVLCLMPAEEINKLHVEIKFMDLVVHFMMFFGFASTLFFDLNKYGVKLNKNHSPLFVAVLVCVVFGISTEILQYLLTFLNRTGSMVDLLFDFLGSLAGIGIVKLIKQKPVSGF